MKEKQIQLCSTGYDPFLDFLKGFCILSVILNHCLGPQKDLLLFPYWGQLAVPLFLLLQVFHVFKRPYRPIDHQQWRKVTQRIVLPFIVVTAIEFLICWLVKGKPCTGLLKATLISGGIGPGSYYPWIYLQFFLILPIVYRFASKHNVEFSVWGGGGILLCIFIELACYYGHMRNDLYRLLCLRYLFLIPLGIVWARNGVRLNATTLGLSLLSIVFITLFRYCGVKLEPLFFFSIYSWEDCHWICYFYPAFLFMFLLHWLYTKLPDKVSKAVVEIGHHSWHIFLLQMAFFVLFPKGKWLSLGSYIPMLVLFVIIAFTTCIAPVIGWQRIAPKKKIMHK